MRKGHLKILNACLNACHCTHVIYDENLRRVEQNPANDRYHLPSEYLFAYRQPKDRVSVVQETGDEHERHRHGKEDLYAVRFIRTPGGLDQFQMNLPSFNIKKRTLSAKSFRKNIYIYHKIIPL